MTIHTLGKVKTYLIISLPFPTALPNSTLRSLLSISETLIHFTGGIGTERASLNWFLGLVSWGRKWKKLALKTSGGWDFRRPKTNSIILSCPHHYLCRTSYFQWLWLYSDAPLIRMSTEMSSGVSQKLSPSSHVLRKDTSAHIYNKHKRMGPLQHAFLVLLPVIQIIGILTTHFHAKAESEYSRCMYKIQLRWHGNPCWGSNMHLVEATDAKGSM